MSEGETAVIVGAGNGLSAAIARKCALAGMTVALAARNIAKLDALVAEIGAKAYACDAAEAADVEALFAAVKSDLGTPGLVVFNASGRVHGPLVEVDPAAVRAAVLTTCYAGFLVGQAAARQMVPAGRGTILFTGASAGIKGFPNSAAFAMGKFGLRGLVESMARELQPMNIHVGQVVIDGGIANAERGRTSEPGEDRLLDPDAIAETYLQLHNQHRSAWTSNIELRPWVEKF